MTEAVLKTPPADTVVNTIRIAAESCVEMPWGSYLEQQYAVWSAATATANAIMYELLLNDQPPWKAKDGKLHRLDDILDVPLNTLAYRVISGNEHLTKVLPTSITAGLSNNLAGVYKRVRRGSLEHQNESLPLYVFPYHYQIPAREVQIDVDAKDQDAFTVNFPFYRKGKGVIERVTLRLKKSRNDRYTTGKTLTGEPGMPLLEKMRTGLLKYGAITLSHDRRRVSARDAKDLPIKRDKFGNRYVYEPVIGFAVHFKTEPLNSPEDQFALVHTDPTQFVAVHPFNGKTWNLCQDHYRQRFNVMTPEEMKQQIEGYDSLSQRLRFDAKSRNPSSRLKATAQGERQHNILSNFIFNMARLIVNNVKTRHSELRYLHSSDEFMPHFPWYMLESTLKNTAQRAGLRFVTLDPFTMRLSEEMTGVKLMNSMKRGDAVMKTKKTKQERIADKKYRGIQKLEGGLEK